MHNPVKILLLFLGPLFGLLYAPVQAQSEGQSIQDELVFQTPSGKVVDRIRPGMQVRCESGTQQGITRLQGCVISVGDSSFVIADRLHGQKVIQIQSQREILPRRSRLFRGLGKAFRAIGAALGGLFLVITLGAALVLAINPVSIAFYTAGFILLIFTGVFGLGLGLLRWGPRPIYPGLSRWKRVSRNKRGSN